MPHKGELSLTRVTATLQVNTAALYLRCIYSSSELIEYTMAVSVSNGTFMLQDMHTHTQNTNACHIVCFSSCETSSNLFWLASWLIFEKRLHLRGFPLNIQLQSIYVYVFVCKLATLHKNTRVDILTTISLAIQLGNWQPGWLMWLLLFIRSFFRFKCGEPWQRFRFSTRKLDFTYMCAIIQVQT